MSGKHWFGQLVWYISKASAKGLSEKEINENLVREGWSLGWIRVAQIYLKIKNRLKISYFRYSNLKLKSVFFILFSVFFLSFLSLIILGVFFLEGPGYFRPDIRFQNTIQNFDNGSSLKVSFEFEYRDEKDEVKPFFWLAKGRYDKVEKEEAESAEVHSEFKFDKTYSQNLNYRNSRSTGKMVLNSMDDDLKSLTLESGLKMGNEWIKLGNFESQDLVSQKAKRILSESKLTRLKRIQKINNEYLFIYDLSLPPSLGIGVMIPKRDQFDSDTYKDLVLPRSAEIGFNWMMNSRYIGLDLEAPQAQKVVKKLALKGLPEVQPINDQKRISDMQDISNELERYFNKFHGYPKGFKGSPVFVREFNWPLSPPAENDCSEYYNTYWYSTEGDSIGLDDNNNPVYPAYKVTFCLGGSVGAVSAGVNKLTPSGIYRVNCENDAYCTIPERNFGEVLKTRQFWQDFPLDATISMKINIEH